ncbi:Transposon Ty3-I Gag-Pol polyprotein [Dictyocoela muelleri]|nr:Transposon Ty3-I Gag-Pol polyprotein [Dictyocoela muelleri]
MNSIFKNIPYVKCYLDNILINSENIKQHFDHIKIVLIILKENNLTINPKKGKFAKNKVTYLGCIISDIGIKPDLSLVNNFNFKTPKNIKELQRIIKFINCFRPFVKNMSMKLLEINKKLKNKNNKIEWNI